MTATIAMNAAPVVLAVANKWDRLPVVAAIAALAVQRCKASMVPVVRVDP
jgi:hypothetical protein